MGLRERIEDARDRQQARRLAAAAQREIDALLGSLSGGTARYSNGSLGALAELHTALARYDPAPGGGHRAEQAAAARVFRLLADVEHAATVGIARRHGRDVEPAVATVLDRMAATPTLPERLAMLGDLRAVVGTAAEAATLDTLIAIGGTRRSSQGPPASQNPAQLANQWYAQPGLSEPAAPTAAITARASGHAQNVGYRPPTR